MRRILWCTAGVLVGYLVGALLGVGLLTLFSQEMHAIPMAELLTGALGAILGLLIAWTATDPAKARRKFDIRDRD